MSTSLWLKSLYRKLAPVLLGVVCFIIPNVNLKAEATGRAVTRCNPQTGELTITLDGKEISVPRHKAQKGKDYPLRVWFRKPEVKVPLHGYDKKIKALNQGFSSPEPDDQVIQKTTFDATTRKLTHAYRWGQVTYQYQLGDDHVDWIIHVENESSLTIWQMNFTLIYLGLSRSSGPAKVTESYFGKPAATSKAVATFEPVVLPMIDNSHAIVACSPETEKPLTLQWIPPSWYKEFRSLLRHNDPEAQQLADAQEKALEIDASSSVFWRLMLAVGGDQLLTHQRYSSRPIPPGQSDTFRVSLRFGDAKQPLQPAKEIIAQFAKKYPRLLNWNDRRPIVRSFIGDWFPFHEPSGPELTKPKGIEPTKEFREKVLQNADNIIADAKAIDAQGMILWNIEGPNSRWVGYVGDPRIVEYRCPEMDAVADAFFAKLKNAGLRTGVCLRPSTIISRKIPSEWKGFKEKHNVDTDWIFGHKYTRKPGGIVDELSAKATYAKKRWGCTLFYVDTNKVTFTPEKDEESWWPKHENGKRKGKFINYSALMNAAQWDELCRRHPDCLFVVEHSNFLYYRSTAPYDQFNMAAGPTPPLVRATWPKAFKSRALEGRDLPGHYHGLVESFRDGDIVLANPGCRNLASSFQDARLEAERSSQRMPEDIAAMSREKLAKLAIDKNAPGDKRYFAACRLLEVSTNPGTVKALLASPDRTVIRLAIDRINGKDYATLIDTLCTMWKGYVQNKDGASATMVVTAVGQMGPDVIETLTSKQDSTDMTFVIKCLSVINSKEAVVEMQNLLATERAKEAPNKRLIKQIERELKNAKKSTRKKK